MKDRSELDELAFQMENAVDRFIGNQNASPNFVMVRYATDESAGNYPQAALDESKTYLEDDGDPYRDRFPKSVAKPIQLKLRCAAKWTDVLSTDGLWSEGFLTTPDALSVFTQFPLGNTRQYTAEVKHGKQNKAYTYLFFANHVALEDVDFKKSEFYIADMIGSPQSVIKVATADDFLKKREQLSQGEVEGFRRFSRLECKRIQFLPRHAPGASVFGLGTLGGRMYVRQELYEALRAVGVTGLAFKRNNMLFDD